METANMMRVNARSGSFAGHGSSPHDKQQQHRQKVSALLEAISSGNLEAARHALQSLVNFDANTLTDTKFAKLSKLLQAGSIYLAQQWAQDFKSEWVNAQPLRQLQGPKSQAPTIRLDGLHVVDVRA
jgi:hypothetical protein